MFTFMKCDNDKILELWDKYLVKDKRSFSEFFSEEFGITLNSDITYPQIKILVKALIKL